MGINDLEFPVEALSAGSLGEYAVTMARGTEVPREFYFASALTYVGAICSPGLSIGLSFDCQPRLYTALVGASGQAKKSTAMKKTAEFFDTIDTMRRPKTLYGVGSAEGLAAILKDEKRVLLQFDEFRAFLDKTRVQGSVLLPVATSLFEQNHWDNATKNKTASVNIRDAHLSMLSCCTDDTFAAMWTPAAISIGFPNRLFIVHAGRTERVAWPLPPDDSKLKSIRQRIQNQLGRLPLVLAIDEKAKAEWTAWYNSMPASEHARRLDTIGFRLMALMTLSMDKDVIDREVISLVTAILDYEFKIRVLTDPIDADNKIAKLEESIRRNLKTRGPMNSRDLRRYTHADREGLWAFNTALKNLENCADIRTSGSDCFEIMPEPLSPDLSPVGKEHVYS